MAIHDFTAERLFVDAPLAGRCAPRLHARAGELSLERPASRRGRCHPGLQRPRRRMARAPREATASAACALEAETQVRPQQAGPDLHYLFAPLKRARLDYMVQKATEMGVARLVPVDHAPHGRRARQPRAHAGERHRGSRAVRHPARAGGRRARQAGRRARAWDRARTLIFCDEGAERRARSRRCLAMQARAPGRARSAPRAALRRGASCSSRQPFARAISLGPRIMRADTAAVAALRWSTPYWATGVESARRPSQACEEVARREFVEEPEPEACSHAPASLRWRFSRSVRSTAAHRARRPMAGADGGPARGGCGMPPAACADSILGSRVGRTRVGSSPVSTSDDAGRPQVAAAVAPGESATCLACGDNDLIVECLRPSRTVSVDDPAPRGLSCEPCAEPRDQAPAADAVRPSLHREQSSCSAAAHLMDRGSNSVPSVVSRNSQLCKASAICDNHWHLAPRRNSPRSAATRTSERDTDVDPPGRSAEPRSCARATTSSAGSRPARSRRIGWRIGTEHEKFVFHTDTCGPVPYDGERGIRALHGGA